MAHAVLEGTTDSFGEASTVTPAEWEEIPLSDCPWDEKSSTTATIISGNNISTNDKEEDTLYFGYSKYGVITNAKERKYDKIQWDIGINQQTGYYMIFGIGCDKMKTDNKQGLHYKLSELDINYDYCFRYESYITSKIDQSNYAAIDRLTGIASGDCITIEIDLLNESMSFWKRKNFQIGNDCRNAHGYYYSCDGRGGRGGHRHGYNGYELRTMSFSDISGNSKECNINDGNYEATIYKNNCIKFNNIKKYYLTVGLSYAGDSVSILKCRGLKRLAAPFNPFKNAKNSLDDAIEMLRKTMKKVSTQNDSENEKDNGNAETANKNDKNDKTDENEKFEIEDILKMKDEIDKIKESMNEIDKKKELLETLIAKVDHQVRKLVSPDTQEYAKWNVNDIILWIMSLENGRYKDYCDELKTLFISNDIKGIDLPDIERTDLEKSFNIGIFRDRVSLEKHFKQLKQENDVTTQTKTAN